MTEQSPTAADRISSPRVLLVNVWHDDNKGDAAIVSGTIIALRYLWSEARFSILTGPSDSRNPRFDDQTVRFRHTLAAHPDVEIFESPVALDLLPGGYQGWRMTLRWIASIMRDLIPGRRNPVFRQHDVVILVGGHYLNSSSRVRGLARLARSTASVFLARRCGIPVVALGHSIGPVEGRAGKRYLKSVLDRVDILWLREHGMIDLLSDSARERVIVAPDVAYLIGSCSEVAPPDDVVPPSTQRVWMMAPRGSVLDSRSSSSTTLAEYARWLIEEDCCDHLVVVAHTLGPTVAENDRVSVSEIVKRAEHPAITSFAGDPSTTELAALYRTCDLVIGARLHAVILATGAGTPAVGVSYFGTKTLGTADWFDGAIPVWDIDALEPELMRNTTLALDTVEMRQLLSKQLSKVRGLLDDAIAELGARLGEIGLPSSGEEGPGSTHS